MKMLDCPHCHRPGISVARKMWLGPAAFATCKACGKKVGVPFTALLAIIPFVVAIVAANRVEPIALKIAVWVAGFLVMSFIHMRWVGLERR